jgi:Chlamydia polymorphic membrane protein (Chlamydia_PMP) repeat
MKQTRILFLFTLLCAAMSSSQAVHANIVTVANANDSGPGSLRQALADANDGDTIDFDSSLNGQTTTLTSGQLVVNKSVTISGLGAANLTIDGNAADRVFYVSPGKTVTISRLTIAHGSAHQGGGIYNEDATLTVSDCIINGNSANDGGGIFNIGSEPESTATLTISNSTLSGNSAQYGGGILNFWMAVTVTNSTLSDNSASLGGGIFNDGEGYAARPTVNVNNSTLSGNSASYGGGGIYNDGFFNDSSYGRATVTVNNSTFSGNSAVAVGGGIWNDGFFGSATLTVNNSTFSGNSAVGYGGGIYNWGEMGSATLALGDTILNGGSSGANIYNDSGAVTSLGYNLSNDDGGGFLTAIGDQINTDPMLGPLQDNGGPTFTHALLPGSPAIDAGDPNFTPPPNYDQRGSGFPRVVNGRLDIGAFEAPLATDVYAAQIQPPINIDGTSIFRAARGIVPVKFTLTLGGVATCALPPATIAVTRTGGGVIGEVNESLYSGNADTGSNFRIDSCQYVYNLNSRALGVGTYRVDILINGQVAGSATFELN